MSTTCHHTCSCVLTDLRGERPGQRLLQEDRLHQPLRQQPHVPAPLRPPGPAPVQGGRLPGEIGPAAGRSALRPPTIDALINTEGTLGLPAPPGLCGLLKSRGHITAVIYCVCGLHYPLRKIHFLSLATKQTSRLIIHNSLLRHNFSFNIPPFFSPLINGLDSHHALLVTRRCVNYSHTHTCTYIHGAVRSLVFHQLCH